MTLQLALTASLTLNVVLFAMLLVTDAARRRARAGAKATQLVMHEVGVEIARKFGAKKAKSLGGAVAIAVEKHMRDKANGMKEVNEKDAGG